MQDITDANQELTFQEACDNHLLREEDYQNQCTTWGRVKNNTTTLYIRGHEDRTVTVNTFALQCGLILLGLVVVGLILLGARRLFRRHRAHS